MLITFATHGMIIAPRVWSGNFSYRIDGGPAPCTPGKLPQVTGGLPSHCRPKIMRVQMKTYQTRECRPGGIVTTAACINTLTLGQ
jgi:hypothetical protein